MQFLAPIRPLSLSRIIRIVSRQSRYAVYVILPLRRGAHTRTLKDLRIDRAAKPASRCYTRTFRSPYGISLSWKLLEFELSSPFKLTVVYDT